MEPVKDISCYYGTRYSAIRDICTETFFIFRSSGGVSPLSVHLLMRS